MESTVLKRFLVITILGFFLNLLWEVLHSLLYDWNAPPLINDIYVYIPRIVFGASCMDALWIFLFLLITCLFRRNFTWIKHPEPKDYLIIIIVGIITAIFIELHAIIFQMWEYNEYMPLIFGIGLTPLVQLATTGALSVYLSTKINWSVEESS